MNYQLKKGFVLVSKIDTKSISSTLQEGWCAAKVVYGAPEDLGTTVLFYQYRKFDSELDLVNIEDIYVWIPKEEFESQS